MSLEKSLRSCYNFNKAIARTNYNSLYFSKAWKFIQDYVTEAHNFEIFYSSGRFWLRMDDMRNSWQDAIRPFESLKKIFAQLDNVYVPETISYSELGIGEVAFDYDDSPFDYDVNSEQFSYSDYDDYRNDYWTDESV